MLPFTSREDVDFFLHLEMHLRQEHPPLCGRDHLAYRSAYFPVKDVIDGDLCEQFAQVQPCDVTRIAIKHSATGRKLCTCSISERGSARCRDSQNANH